MKAISHCPEGLSKDSMSAISAPYNFVPLNRWVYIPEWGKQVSHDWPFKDGVSGVIEYTLIAESPLLVGGKHKPATDNQPGEVKPFQLPDGRYAIPGSSLKGMLRSVVEIAGYGRMRMVDDLRPGLRDISGKNVSASYGDKVRNKVKTGFLRRRDDGGQEIVPCKMTRVSHREIESALRTKKPVFRARTNVGEKYGVWRDLCHRNNWNPDEVRFDLGDHEAVNLGRGDNTGFPVFTGQISDSTKPKGKYKDFIFYDRREQESIPVSDESWRDFLLIHGDEEGKSDMSWPGYWKKKFREGHDVPVFYLQDDDLLRIGLAYMPKLAGDFSIHDVIGHASKQHLHVPGEASGYDLADLIFGAIGEEQNDALRGRVSFETAVAEGNPQPEQQPDTILNGPKPTYFPNYIEQKTTDGKTLSGSQYATYMVTPAQKKPRARGFKRYPARQEDKVGLQKLNPDQEKNKKVQVRLHPLPAGTRFTGRVVFHNLKPEELGALLWAMTWGGNEGLRHGLGMGKPFGFGQVRFGVSEENSRLFPNDPDKPEGSLDCAHWRNAFARHMEGVARTHREPDGWLQSERLLALLAMADPVSATKLLPGMSLRHMCLNAKAKVNEFTWAKQKNLILADYATASKYARRLREAEEARRQQEAEERQRREEAAARKQAEEEKAAFEALPEAEKERIRFEKFLSELPETLTKERYPELVGEVNKYLEKAEEWSREEREKVAEDIEAAYDKYGWGTPGVKSVKKKKQERKKREALMKLLREQ